MATWGPVQRSIGPGAQTPDARRVVLHDSGQVGIAGLTLISGTASVTFTGGRNDAAWAIEYYAYGSDDVLITSYDLYAVRLTTTTVSWSVHPTPDTTRYVIQFAGSLYQGQTMTATANGLDGSATYCPYGTRVNAGSPLATVFTLASLTALLDGVDASRMVQFVVQLIGQTLDIVGLCSGPPQQIPSISRDAATWSPDEALQFVKSVAWHSYCECIPGTPAPVPYPEPVVTVPTGVPDRPVFTCTPDDICAALIAIQEQINALTTVATSDYAIDTLQQRYRLPFAYIRGATHSNLQGNGQFAVSRLIGVQVVVTSKPADGIVLPGNPPYNWNMGWLSIVGPDGMFEEKRLTRDGQLWFPSTMQQASFFQWSLFAGVTVTVTELEAEP